MNECDCPEPPGGSIRCRDDQLAICGYRDGKIVSGCYDRPGYIRILSAIQEHSYSQEAPRLDDLVLCNWIISSITGYPRRDAEPVDDSHLAFLRRGKYGEDSTGLTLKFSMPNIFQKDLNHFVDERTVRSIREWRSETLDEHILTERLKSVVETSHRLHQGAALEQMNRALIALRAWYDEVVSAGLSQEALSERALELTRLSDEYAKRVTRRLWFWTGAGKIYSYLFGFRRVRQDVRPDWVELLQKTYRLARTPGFVS